MLEIIDGNSVPVSLKGFSRYPTRNRDPWRLAQYPTVFHKPKFRIDRAARLFTIGSCFALNIERALLQNEMLVLSDCPDRQHFVKYTTKSILWDLDAAFDPERWPSIIYRLGESIRLLNFSTSVAKRAITEDECNRIIGQYFSMLQKISQSDVVVMTLGLVENWYDRKRGQYLNVMPTRDFDRDDFECRVLSYDDVVADLRSIVGRIGTLCDAKIVLTVSPVPLVATFRDQDCIRANAYSKAVQRAAVEAICMENDRVDYFPSYEIVSMADMEYAWRTEDFRHVRSDMVEYVVKAA